MATSCYLIENKETNKEAKIPTLRRIMASFVQDRVSLGVIERVQSAESAQTARTGERAMSLNQQVESQNPQVLGFGRNWAVATSTGTRTGIPAQRARLGTIFTRSMEERFIANGKLFRQLLSLEQKRAERNANSTVLAVLDVKSLLQEQIGPKAMAPIERAIFSAIRTTDLVGWYDESQSSLGILFTEIAEANEKVVSTILMRVTEAILANAAEGLVSKLDVSCQVFVGQENKESVCAERPFAAAD